MAVDLPIKVSNNIHTMILLTYTLTSVPAGIVAVIILIFSIPAGFPYHKIPGATLTPKNPRQSNLLASLRKIDFLGATLLLAGSLLLSTGLLEGGSTWEWKSAESVSILTISVVLLGAFFVWEKMVTTDRWTQEPMFPWRFLHNRVWMGVLL
jgi:hypothetical protein